MCTDEPRLAIFDMNISFRQLRAGGTQAFCLPSFEREAGFERVLDEIVMAGAPVYGDNPALRLVCGFLAHCVACFTASGRARHYTDSGAGGSPDAADIIVSLLDLYKNRRFRAL